MSKSQSGSEKVCEFRVMPEISLVVCSYQGAVTMGDLIDITREFMAQPDFDPEFNVCVDLLHCKGIAFRLDLLDYVEFARKSLKLKKKVRAGILVQSINYEYLIKVYKSFGPLLKLEIESFRHLDDFFTWMGYDENQRGLILKYLKSIWPVNPIF